MVRHQLGVSERRACRVLGHARSTHRHRARVPDNELRLVERIIALATQYGRYGYRRITGLLRGEDWRVNHKRVERLWRREGLKVPQKQPKRGRLWLTDGSCVRCRPAYRLHVWAYDFLTARTHDGRPLKILTVVEEYSRECLAIVVARRLRSTEVLETLAELFVTHGVPAHIRSGQRPRVYSHAHPAVAGRAAGADTVHRAGESLGERVCRIVQREVARQTARPRDLLHVDGSKDLDRTVASAVQHSSAAQRVGLSATGPGSHQPSAPERHDHEPSSLIRTGSTPWGAGQWRRQHVADQRVRSSGRLSDRRSTALDQRRHDRRGEPGDAGGRHSRVQRDALRLEHIDRHSRLRHRRRHSHRRAVEYDSDLAAGYRHERRRESVSVDHYGAHHDHGAH